MPYEYGFLLSYPTSFTHFTAGFLCSTNISQRSRHQKVPFPSVQDSHAMIKKANSLLVLLSKFRAIIITTKPKATASYLKTVEYSLPYMTPAT